MFRHRTEAHVVPERKGGWEVVKGGSEVVRDGSGRSGSTHRTRQAATREARELIRESGGGDVVVHDRQGRMRHSQVVRPLKYSGEAAAAWGHRAKSGADEFL